MRIAVLIENRVHAGGGFQQGLSTARILEEHQSEDCEFVYFTIWKTNLEILKAQGITAYYLGWTAWVYWALSRFLLTLKVLRTLGVLISFPVERRIVRNRVDMVYFLMPSPFAILLRKTNFVITVWDLCHRDHPEFPEVSLHSQFEYREYIFTHALPKAVAILVDSELGKSNVVRRYGCDGERVCVARFLPALDTTKHSDIDVAGKYAIGQRYVFYPAQFWAHKNHVYILDGLAVLKNKFGVTLDVVFSGSDKGNLNYVRGYATKLGLGQNVHCVGFITDAEMISFYKNALALVMPTYFGPTNLPPLEAFACGCPVCYSDLPGLRDQVGDAAFLIDLNDPESLAAQLIAIQHDSANVQVKIAKGKALLGTWTQDDYWNVLDDIFSAFARKLKCWRCA